VSAFDWRALLGFEARYQLRRWTFVVTTLALSGFAATMVATAYAAQGIAVNAPAAVMQSLGLLSLWALFTQTVFTVHAALRDTEYGMTELISTRPIARGTLLAVRVAGVIGAGALAFGIATLVLLVAPHLLVDDPARVAPMQLTAYVVAFATLVVPNLVLVTALLFAVAAIGRTTMATYVGAIALFAAYMVTALAVASPLFAGGAPPTPESLARAAVLDPFGLSAFFEQSRYWTAAQREREVVALTGRYLVNRVLWLGVAALALVVAVRRLSTVTGRRVPRGAPTDQREALAAGPTSPSYRPVVPSAAVGAALWSTWRMELRLLAGSWAIRALLLVLVVVTGIELVQNLGAGEYGTRLLATSGELARRATEPLAALGVLMLVYVATDVLWRERAARFDRILDATPQPSGVALGAKLLALMTICVVCTGVAIGVAVGVQLVLGGAAIEPGVYLAHAATTVWPLMLWAVLCAALHAITGNRWAGLLAAVVLVVARVSGNDVGLEHPMTRFSAAPALRWSDLDGFGPSLPSFVAFTAYWSVVTLLVATVAWGVWPRGESGTLRTRARRAWRGSGAPWRWTLRAMSLVVLVGAAALWQVTWANGRWSGRDASRQWRAEYERRFRPLLDRPHPRVVHADLRVRLEPRASRATVTGALLLRNVESRAIDTVWLSFDADARVERLVIGATTAVRPDARYAMHAIALPTPLRAGDTTRVSYTLRLDRSRVNAEGYDRALTTNGTYLTTDDLLPLLGYRGRMELADSVTRVRLGLGAATPQLRARDAAGPYLATLRREGQPRAWMTSRIVVATDSTQIPLATGTLRRTWVAGDERLAEFTQDALTAPRLAVLSGRYAVRRKAIGATTIELWHHPSHVENVDRVLDAAATSLAALARRFGPYPMPTLRIVELPTGWGFGAFAMPGTLLLTENRGMRLDARREQVDLLLRRIGHEVAHQWWGGVVTPADVLGAGTIVEALAKYAEQRVVAEVHGEAALPPMLAFDHDRYLAGRAQEAGAERTLADAGFVDDYLFYGKAAIGFHALHASLGDSAMTRALRAVITTEQGPFGAATTTALRASLDAEARTDDQRALIAEWFDARVIHDIALDSATAQQDRGRTVVRASGRAERIDRQGRDEVVAPAAGLAIEARVLGAPGASGAAPALWSGRVRTQGDGSFALIVPVNGRPASVEVDPRYLRIDRNRSNNVRAVAVVGAEARLVDATSGSTLPW
jgi:ABC-type transport system involved in multi-copper enzyme maturation permease subunit